MSLMDRANQLLAALLANSSIVHPDKDGQVEMEKIWLTKEGEKIGKYYTPVELALEMSREMEKKATARERMNLEN
jgi:hypothetical protein